MQAHPLSNTAARNFTYATQVDPPANAFASANPQNLQHHRASFARPEGADEAGAEATSFEAASAEAASAEATSPEAAITGIAGNHRPAAPAARLAGCPQALAHDAHNLLLALGLYGDLLSLPGILQPQHQHYARELQLLGRRSTRLIGRLLEAQAAFPQTQPAASAGIAVQPLPAPLGRMTSRALASPRASDPGAVLRGFAPLLAAIASPRIRVSVACRPGLPALPFAAETLERILVNLVRNAAEAITAMQTSMLKEPACDGSGGAREDCARGEDGHIRVALRSAGREVRLTVADNGPGLPAALAAAFLHPAPLLAGARRGLGHRIVADLVAATAGRLSIRPVAGGGTRITITWTATGVRTRKSAASCRRRPQSWRQPTPPQTLTAHPLHEGAFASC